MKAQGFNVVTKSGVNYLFENAAGTRVTVTAKTRRAEIGKRYIQSIRRKALLLPRHGISDDQFYAQLGIK